MIKASSLVVFHTKVSGLPYTEGNGHKQREIMLKLWHLLFCVCAEKFNDWVLSSDKNLFKYKRSRLGSQPNKLTKDSVFKIIEHDHYNMKGVSTQFCLLSFTKYRDDLNEYSWAYFNMPWGNSARICFSNVQNSHSYCILREKKHQRKKIRKDMW